MNWIAEATGDFWYLADEPSGRILAEIERHGEGRFYVKWSGGLGFTSLGAAKKYVEDSIKGKEF